MKSNELTQNEVKATSVEPAEVELNAEQLQGIVGGALVDYMLACRKSGGDSIIAV